MKAKDLKLFTHKAVQSGIRPLLNLGMKHFPADEDYPECDCLDCVTLFGEHYCINPEDEVLKVETSMMEEAVRIEFEYNEN